MGKVPRLVPAFRTVGSYRVAVGCGMPVRFLDIVVAVVRSGQLGGGASGKSGCCVPSAKTSTYTITTTSGTPNAENPELSCPPVRRYWLGSRRSTERWVHGGAVSLGGAPGQACLRFRRGRRVGWSGVAVCLTCLSPAIASESAGFLEFTRGQGTADSERCA